MRFFSTRGEDVLDGWFSRCRGCGRLLHAARVPWTIRPTDGEAFHLKCARPFKSGGVLYIPEPMVPRQIAGMN